MKIHQFVNPHRLSNTYALELDFNEVVLVDVGNFDTTDFLKWLAENNKALTHVMLTHEHADHCCGLDSLYKTHPFQLLCTLKCAENCKDSRQNFSYYLEDIPTFEVALTTISTINDYETKIIGGQLFTFIATPGHSPGGMCILADDFLFTGDTILNGIKAPLTFPHSNRRDYQISIEKISTVLKKGMTIYPGHDSPFSFQKFENFLV
jgi:glyoxylase-like metal-dependent hydrolase (beta-lactamase superfamily II)